MDGVLVDSRQGIVSCVNATLSALGYEAITNSAVEEIIGPSLLIGFRSILERQGRDSSAAADCVLNYRALYADAAVSGTKLQPGVFDILKQLHREAVLAVATSKPLIFADPILRALGIREAFEVVAGPTPETDGETKSETLMRALSLIRKQKDTWLNRENALMVGDRDYDIVAAIETGIVAVGATWGFGSQVELIRAGADVVIATPGELPPVVRALGTGG